MKDVTDHPWAGADVVMTLTARDEGGNEGKSEPLRSACPSACSPNHWRERWSSSGAIWRSMRARVRWSSPPSRVSQRNESGVSTVCLCARALSLLWDFYLPLSIRYICGMIRLTDEQWERIRKHFPVQAGTSRGTCRRLSPRAPPRR